MGSGVSERIKWFFVFFEGFVFGHGGACRIGGFDFRHVWFWIFAAVRAWRYERVGTGAGGGNHRLALRASQVPGKIASHDPRQIEQSVCG